MTSKRSAASNGRSRTTATRWWHRTGIAAAAVTAGLCLAACGQSAAEHPPTSGTSTLKGSTGTGTTAPKGSTTTTTLIAQPTAAHPVTIMIVGDSLGEDLGLGFGDILGTNPLVHVVQDAVGDTGLSNEAYYDWPVHFEADLQAVHPQVVVVLLGGNDAQGFDQNGLPYEFATAGWTKYYTERVALMMSEARAAGAEMIWVGLPIMGPAAAISDASMQQLDSIYQQQAALHPGVLWFPSRTLFESSSGGYTQYVTNQQGETVIARDPDEVHLTPGGYDYLATAVSEQIQRTFHLDFTPPTSTTTTTTASSG